MGSCHEGDVVLGILSTFNRMLYQVKEEVKMEVLKFVDTLSDQMLILQVCMMPQLMDISINHQFIIMEVMLFQEGVLRSFIFHI